MLPGAIFTENQKDSPSELAFKYAVYMINKDKTILPNTTLVYDIQHVPRDDSFRTSKKGKTFSILYILLPKRKKKHKKQKTKTTTTQTKKKFHFNLLL